MAVELRPWKDEDAASLSDASKGNLDLHTQFGGVDLSEVDHARHYIREHLTLTESSRNWAIISDGVAVGNVGLAAIERRHGTAWAYYWLATAARGQGFASRSLATVAAEAFADGIFRLELGHRVNNPASCTVATRAGFPVEGLERQKLKYGTERFDVETHARLHTDPSPALELLPTAR